MAVFHKIGTVNAKKDGSGFYIGMGNPKGKKYAYSVELIIKDATGKVVHKVENPFVNIQDPRKRPGITEEQASKIPEFIKNELFVIQNDEE